MRSTLRSTLRTAPQRTAPCHITSSHPTTRLGVVLFQFQSSFAPSEAARRTVEECRRQLQAGVPMAIEFRCRRWIAESAVEETRCWLRDLGIALVASDDLAHEIAQPDRAQKPLAPGEEASRLPIAKLLTQPTFSYVRIHRRQVPASPPSAPPVPLPRLPPAAPLSLPLPTRPPFTALLSAPPPPHSVSVCIIICRGLTACSAR